MTVFWPTTLPLPSIEGYGLHPGEAILRTEMEAGPARQRRRYTQVPSRISVKWMFRKEQFALFEAWYRWHAKEGGEWFEIDLLGGLGLVVHEARFTRPFDARPRSAVLWDVSSELEIRERPTLDKVTLDIFLDSDPMSLLGSVSDLNALIHQRLPGPMIW